MAITSGEVSAAPKPRGESKVNSVDRALVILEYLGTQSKEVGVRELGQNIGLSKSSVHRILQTLRARGFVRWNPENARYSLGMKAFEVGSGILRSMEAHSAAKFSLEQLVNALGETAFLGVIDGSEMVYVDKIDGRRALRMVADIGARSPLHSTAIGKALLAYSDRAEIDRMLAGKPLTRYTDNTLTDAAALRQELEKIRRQGYSEDDEEAEQGLYGVGAPLFNYSGRAVAAISVAAPKMAQQQPSQKENIVKHVVEAAQEISVKLGYTIRPKPEEA
ncbi:MAG: IclR family transcriptional regulator [Candidatus Eremiobacteraeota bacterium]|nr:IclR family transcriptional regulator [Candidatus Eremiobacteraeota bacterium]MBC5827128.1 IclR family transcriptional regulator [Candidatus Eremiobacteraeota bacterium]